MVRHFPVLQIPVTLCGVAMIEFFIICYVLFGFFFLSVGHI